MRINYHAMNFVDTRFGRIEGIHYDPLYSNRRTDGCDVTKKTVLSTPYGDLIPQYETEDIGRRARKPVYFFKNRNLKSLPIQQQTVIKTAVGDIPAELVTFYESGHIKRIFPLDGKLSGFWSWKNEMELAEPTTIDTPGGPVTAKLLGIQFYENSSLKSLTLWPNEEAEIETPYGCIAFRKGAAFYENGNLRSIEPLKKTDIPTPVGTITAFDNEPNGIHGDINSLQFDPDGLVSALSTIDNEIAVGFPSGSTQLFKPGSKNNVCGDERKVSVPMKVRFDKNTVIFNEGTPFSIESCSFDIRKHTLNTGMPAYACSA